MNIKEHFKCEDGLMDRARIKSKSGRFEFSIVAGEYAYSTPRHLMNSHNYKEVEVAIFNEEGDWAKREEVEFLFPILGEGEYGGMEHAVFAYIPVSAVEQAIEAF